MASLAHVGFMGTHLKPSVYLAETELRLERTAPTHVLFQNAWTVIPRREAHQLLEEYPLRRRLREVARRRIASLNGRRANEALTLTRYMADLVEAQGIAPTRAVEVGASIDLFHLEPSTPSGASGLGTFALVPGSVQPYKNPAGALEYLASMDAEHGLDAVVFAGPVHDPRLAQSLHEAARAMSLVPHFSMFTRDEMKWLYLEAEVVVLPSKLESLNFSLGEALYFGRRVAVSPLPVHREVADSLGARPLWIGEPESAYAPAQVDGEALLPAWHALRDIISTENAQ